MPVVLDCEIYPNYFLLCVKVVETGFCHKFCLSPAETFNRSALLELMQTELTIGFNSLKFDVHVINAAICGYSTEQIHRVAQRLINGERHWAIGREFSFDSSTWNHIDLIETCPLTGSLKLYAARLHCRHMQEVNFPVTEPLTEEQAAEVESYCRNDVENTELLYRELMPHLALLTEMSKTYGIDLRSSSDAQIAEAVIPTEVQKITCRTLCRPKYESYVDRAFRFRVPEWCNYFEAPHLRRIVETVSGANIVVNGFLKPECAEIKSLLVVLGKMKYQMGLGGLHSCESCVATVADSSFVLLDIDAKSFYPRTILSQKLYPKALGPAFLSVFEAQVIARLSAVGSERDARKILINGTFGKLIDSWSKLFSPENGIQVTLTGQLGILLLIEMVLSAGAEVISGNTDGALIKCPVLALPALMAAIKEWERITGFETEEQRYRAVYAKDVNNYLALKDDGKWKLKGVYAKVGSARNSPLAKNPDAYITSFAMQARLKDGTSVADTITAATDIREFVRVQQCKAPGAHKDGRWLGKTIRWYYSTEVTGVIQRVGSDHKIDETDNARPCLTLPAEMPKDLDRQWYINRAEQGLWDVGFNWIEFLEKHPVHQEH